MRSSTSIHERPEALQPLQTRLTWSLVAGAMLFLVALEALYLLAYTACAGGPRWPMHGVALAAATLSAATAVWAWSKRADAPTSEGGGSEHDLPWNWLARASALANGAFVVIILSMEVIVTMMRRCW